MNDARREEIRQVLTLIEEAKHILEGVLDQQQHDFDNMPTNVQNDEEGQRTEEVVDALEQATTAGDLSSNAIGDHATDNKNDQCRN